MRDRAFQHTEKSSPYRKPSKASSLLVAILLLAACVSTSAFAAPASGGESPPAFESAMESFESKWRVGNTVTFGVYEQDNNTENGKEAIRWRVLAREDDKALLISVDNLESKSYHIRADSVTWEASTLRTWLNGDFLNTAFTPAQQEAILTTTLRNKDNPMHRTDGGKDTSDKVFLLSIEEAETLFSDNEDRIAKNSAYTRALGAYTNDSGVGWWWLRSPGYDRSSAVYVLADGSVDRTGHLVTFNFTAVRPALWLDLTSNSVTSTTP